MRVNDLISGAFLVALAVAMIAYTTTFPPFPGQNYGPDLFPRVIGAGLILCGVLLMIRGRRLLAAGEKAVAIDPAYRPAKAWMSATLIVGAIGFYIALSNLLGFVITGFLITFGLLVWFGTGLVRAGLIAIAAVLVIDWFFGYLFRVPLPLGVLPNGPSYMLMNLLRGAM